MSIFKQSESLMCFIILYRSATYHPHVLRLLQTQNRHGVPPVINENFIIQLIKNASYA
jgi:hypothetical protein